MREEGEEHTGRLVWKPEGKRPLGRSSHAWEDNVKNDFGWEFGEWINLS